MSTKQNELIIVDGLTVQGPVTASNFLGNLLGSASFALSSNTASISLLSVNALNSISSAYADSASIAVVALTANTASYILSSKIAGPITANQSYFTTQSFYATQSLNATRSIYAVSSSWVSASVRITLADTASHVLAGNVSGVVGYSLQSENANQSLFSVQSLNATRSLFAYSASWVSSSVRITNADTASYVLSSSYATTASLLLGSVEHSFNADSASYAKSASISDYAKSSSFLIYNGSNNGTASYSISGAYAATASYVNLAKYAQGITFEPSTSSFARKAISASYLHVFEPARVYIDNSLNYVETGSVINCEISGGINSNDETYFNTGSILINGVKLVYSMPSVSLSASNFAMLDSNISSSKTYSVLYSTGHGVIASNVKTVNFVFPFLYGSSSNSNLSGGLLYSSLTKDTSSLTYANKAYSHLTGSAASYIYVAYPAEYPDLIYANYPSGHWLLPSLGQAVLPVTSSGLVNNWSKLYKVYSGSLLMNGEYNYDFSDIVPTINIKRTPMGRNGII
jgi:hypothetical protein